ncbi:hypothetical protein SAY87_017796 [Trapa incisa]|uniref:Uncharacterized protein n=1 Tax=Trapa incisa TaxID=236973 RepID=A0AAN7L4D7_9MYRT|nr:hypothetical protein SAY87_017796 [Trapa incisa]
MKNCAWVPHFRRTAGSAFEFSRHLVGTLVSFLISVTSDRTPALSPRPDESSGATSISPLAGPLLNF